MQKDKVYSGLPSRGKGQDDIFFKIHKSVAATIIVPAGTKIRPAEPLVSIDGGLTFSPVYMNEYDSTKADYKRDNKVVEEGVVYKALVDDPDLDSLADDTKWKNEGAYVINGAAMITFERETKDAEESFKAAVAVDCEISASSMVQFNESCRVAGFPNILMR